MGAMNSRGDGEKFVQRMKETEEGRELMRKLPGAFTGYDDYTDSMGTDSPDDEGDDGFDPAYGDDGYSDGAEDGGFSDPGYPDDDDDSEG
jgi:hypothetical protein